MHHSVENDGRMETPTVAHRAAAEPRLVSLSQFAIAADEPDVRGWVVIAEDGHRVGRVYDVLVDAATRALRYLMVNLDRGLATAEAARAILVPVGRARVATRRPQVNLCGVRRFDVAYAPRLRAETPDSTMRERVRRFFAHHPALPAHPGNEEAVLFDQHGFWGARRRGREDQPYLAAHLGAAAPGQPAALATE